MAKEFIRKKKASKAAKIAGAAAIVGGAIALPFTFGASSAAIAAGAALTIGTVTLSAAELAIIIGGAVAILGVVKGCHVELKNDGTVVVEPKYKN